MTDSVKFLSASYGAEYAKGPAVLQAFSKSGGQKFHGEGYFYARNTAIGYANDWFNKDQELCAESAELTDAPKLLLYRRQRRRPGLLPAFQPEQGQAVLLGRLREDDPASVQPAVEMNVPTAAQRSGDFSTTGVPTDVYNPATNGGLYANAYRIPCNTDDGWQGCNPAISPWAGQNATGPEQLLRPDRRNR